MRSTKPRKPASTSSDPDLSRGGILIASPQQAKRIPYRYEPPGTCTASEGCWFLIFRYGKERLAGHGSHSAEFDAVNQLLNQSAKPEDITL